MEKIRASEKNVILLDGGDTYQGNMWFGYYKGTAAVTFMNYTKYDVMVSFHKTIIQALTICGREEGTKFVVIGKLKIICYGKGPTTPIFTCCITFKYTIKFVFLI